MSEVSISINGRSYDIGCDDGQEGHIIELASYIDYKFQQIARSGAALNEMHLMVLTSLMLTDELVKFRTMVEKNAGSKKSGAAAAPAEEAGLSKDDEVALAKVLENLVKRIDGIADRLQAA